MTHQPAAAEAFCDDTCLAERIAAAVPDLLYIYELSDRRMIYISPALATTLGYDRGMVAGWGLDAFTHLLHPDDNALWLTSQRHRLEAAPDQTPIVFECRARHHNGEWRWFQAREVVFTRDADGKPQQILGSARDITDQKRAQHDEQRRISREKEHELAGLRNRFMATVSHEFRTPLASILSSSELLGRYHERLSPARREECVALIRSQVLHMKQLMDDLSLVIEGGTRLIEHDLVEVDLSTFCQRIANEARATASPHYAIVLASADNLGTGMLYVDLVEHILHNLLSNAVKFSPGGGTIRLETHREQQNIVFRISDQGIGIPPEDVERVFDTFHRANNVGNIGGIGLGLKIVSDFVALLQGQISVESVEGQGTVFTVRLPLNLVD